LLTHCTIQAYHGNNKGSACIDLFTESPCEVPIEKITLPPGFKIEHYATVPNARQLALTDDGKVLFVGSWEGDVHALYTDNPQKVRTHSVDD